MCLELDSPDRWLGPLRDALLVCSWRLLPDNPTFEFFEFGVVGER
jgi:hypothetical protein